MGWMAQAATHQPLGPNAQALENSQGRGGAARHAFRHHQRVRQQASRSSRPSQPISPAQAPGQQRLHPPWIHGLPTAQAACWCAALQGRQAQVGDGRRHGATQIHHQGVVQQAQIPQHHVADQGRGNPRRQGRQAMGPLGQGAQKQ